MPYFTRVFNLRIDDDAMRRRLQKRTDNTFGKQPWELELMLELNRSEEKPAGAIDLDATQPVNQVVDELLRLANLPGVTDTVDPKGSMPASQRHQPGLDLHPQSRVE